MAQYLYRIQPTRAAMLTDGPTEAEAATVSAHFSYLQTLVEQGVVILAGPTLNTDPTNFGLVIFNADSDEAARTILDEDPAVSGGVMRAELFPFRVSLIAENNVLS